MSNLAMIQSPINAQLQAELKRATSLVDKRLKKLAGDFSYIFKAPANFKYNELDGNNINIQTCTDLTYLIKCLSKMKRIEKEYNDTMSEIGIKEYPVCKWLGTPTSAWIEDLTVLVKRQSNKTLIEQLAKKKEELSQFMSADEKLSNVLNELKSLL